MNTTHPTDSQEQTLSSTTLHWINQSVSNAAGIFSKIAPIARSIRSRIIYSTPKLARKIAIVRSSKETTCVPTAIRMFLYAVTGELLLSEETARKIAEITQNGESNTSHLNASFLIACLEKHSSILAKTSKLIKDCHQWDDTLTGILKKQRRPSRRTPIVFAENVNHVILTFPTHNESLWWVIDPFGFSYGASSSDLQTLGYVPKFKAPIHASLATGIAPVHGRR